jgi:tellurite methyltransferase
MDSDKIIQRYNNIYSQNKNVFGKGNPVKEVTDIPGFLKSGSIMELGAGQGRNSIYLAEKGFDVTAVDFSLVGLENIKQQAEEKNLKIVIENEDVANFDIPENYDAFVATFVLHELNREDALSLITKMKNHTNLGGLNIIATFINKGDLKGINPEKFKPEEGELKDLYSDWEVLSYTEQDSMMNSKRADGTNMHNFTATITARKKT